MPLSSRPDRRFHNAPPAPGRVFWTRWTTGRAVAGPDVLVRPHTGIGLDQGPLAAHVAHAIDHPARLARVVEPLFDPTLCPSYFALRSFTRVAQPNCR